ncbi:unnamed protein product [Pylaiella littoralis]
MLCTLFPVLLPPRVVGVPVVGKSNTAAAVGLPGVVVSPSFFVVFVLSPGGIDCRHDGGVVQFRIYELTRYLSVNAGQGHSLKSSCDVEVWGRPRPSNLPSYPITQQYTIHWTIKKRHMCRLCGEVFFCHFPLLIRQRVYARSLAGSLSCFLSEMHAGVCVSPSGPARRERRIPKKSGTEFPDWSKHPAAKLQTLSDRSSPWILWLVFL